MISIIPVGEYIFVDFLPRGIKKIPASLVSVVDSIFLKEKRKKGKKENYRDCDVIQYLSRQIMY